MRPFQVARGMRPRARLNGPHPARSLHAGARGTIRRLEPRPRATLSSRAPKICARATAGAKTGRPEFTKRARSDADASRPSARPRPHPCGCTRARARSLASRNKGVGAGPSSSARHGPSSGRLESLDGASSRVGRSSGADRARREVKGRHRRRRRRGRMNNDRQVLTVACVLATGPCSS